jgi:hypothetical protein
MKLNAQWIVGFVDGEGCFHIGMNKNSRNEIREFRSFLNLP